ncbi:MAG: hypothetical protein ACYC3H_04650 [Bellilinea sp.]
MRKFVIFLTILVFLACLGFGLYTSYKPELTKKQAEGDNSAQMVTPVSQFQNNYLVIHVDDLTADAPQLISVWGLIAYFPEPKLIFQALYPLATATNADIQSRYALSSQKVPDPVFLRTLEQVNQITWDNYILLDNLAFDQLGLFVYGGGLSIESVTNPLPAEQSYMQTLCDTFSIQGRNFLEGFQWKEIIPDHFRSNVSMDFGLVNIDRLLSPGLQVRCEIFGY